MFSYEVQVEMSEREAVWGAFLEQACTMSPVHPKFTEEAFYIAREIWVRLEKGEFAACDRLIMQAQERLQEILKEDSKYSNRGSLESLLNESIVFLDIPLRTINALESQKIRTIRDLLSKNRTDLMYIPLIGEGSVRKIEKALLKKGLKRNELGELTFSAPQSYPREKEKVGRVLRNR
jgi:DNA-directed RNA polymerase alpha subunit